MDIDIFWRGGVHPPRNAPKLYRVVIAPATRGLIEARRGSRPIRHGADAVIEAARLVDLMLDRGDRDGQFVWLRIKRAIDALLALSSGPLNGEVAALG
jgi:hypothetical protein